MNNKSKSGGGMTKHKVSHHRGGVESSVKRENNNNKEADGGGGCWPLNECPRLDLPSPPRTDCETLMPVFRSCESIHSFILHIIILSLLINLIDKLLSSLV
jgi:hypothetical protein